MSETERQATLLEATAAVVGLAVEKGQERDWHTAAALMLAAERIVNLSTASTTVDVFAVLRERRRTLVAKLEVLGGRDVELAERIDTIDHVLAQEAP